MYNWHRYYDPETGRYVSSDNIGLAGGLNTYGYAYQNPVNYIDPDGQIAFLAIPLLGGAGGISSGTLGTALLGGGALATVFSIPSDSAISDNNQYSYSDDGHREENELLDNLPLDHGFFDPNNNNCDENRKRLKFLRERLERQLDNRASGFANLGIQNQASAQSHAIRIQRLRDKIREYERAVEGCPPEDCD